MLNVKTEKDFVEYKFFVESTIEYGWILKWFKQYYHLITF